MGRSLYSILFFLISLYFCANLFSVTSARRSNFLRCGSHYLSPGEYWIASPRCIKKACNCEYSIKVSAKNIITITCPRFSSSSRWCKQNHLQIHVWKYCGRNKPRDVSRRGDLKIIAFSRGHPEKIKYLCQILVSLGRSAVSTSISVASTSVLTATTALTQAPTTAASKSTVSAAVPPTSPTSIPETTAAPTTIVPETSASYTTVSSTGNPSSTTVPKTTVAPTTIVPETSLETTVSSTANPSSTTVPKTTAAPSTIVPETSLETTVSSTANPSSTTVRDTTTMSTTTSPPCQPQPPAPVQCGQANHIRKVRIAGGEEAGVYEFPWLAAVVNPFFPTPYCSATILNSLYLITHRICLNVGDFRRLKIQFHKHFSSVDEHQMEVKIESKIPHPDVQIALLKLRAPIKFPVNNSVAPICLPPTDRTDYAGADGIVAGWGLAVSGENNSRPKALMKLSVTVASDEDCQPKNHPFNIRQHLCTKRVDGKGACPEDHGAPLITAGTDDKYSIIGVTKYVGCGKRSSDQDTYVRITPLLPWIREQIADGNFCTNQ